MKYGVVDIGSNTVRAVVYDVSENDMSVCKNIAVGSKLFAYTLDGQLTDEGINWLTGAIRYLINETGEGCDFAAFATSAFRDLKNRENVKALSEALCGIRLYILSGDEEAECDRIALKTKGIKSGVAVDLGGGSCQIIAFDEEQVSLSVSLPLGCVRLKRMLVKGEIPDKNELSLVYAHTKELAGEYFKNKSDSLIIFGGTAGTLAKLAKNAGLEADTDKMSISTLEKLSDITGTDEGVKLLRDTAEKRCETVPVGAATLLCIAKGIEASKIILPEVSVRDGFLVKYILK